jgi:very-short-patch-repair endonuclease
VTKASLSYKQFDYNGNMRYISPELKALCREYRKNPTDAETVMWKCLRNRKLSGYKFLRQHPIGGYIVDFFCYKKHLVVEIDGGIHNRKDIHEKDVRRQRFLEQNGYKVVRYTNTEVQQSLEKVL